jgi:type IV pilus assembly protein PilO
MASLNDLPPRQQWIVAGVLCVALIFIYYFQFWSANATEIDRLYTQSVEIRNEINRIRAIAAELPELQAELAQLEGRLEILRNILPEQYETADLLRGVAAIAAQSNLELRDLEFKDPVPYEFYAESPIELEFDGSFHDLARFFDRIGKFARIINVDDVDINALDGEASHTVNATVTAKTFIFLEDETPDEDDGPGEQPARRGGRR